MNVEIKQVALSDIELNPDNPRTITGRNMDRLVKSLTEFPEMLELREIVVDETMTVLGGNIRLLALRKSGAKTATAKIVNGLTPEQKREFVIKDNSGFGDWNMDALANEWSDLPLAEWGVDLPEDWLKTVDGIDAPELKSGDRAPFQQMTFTLHDEQAEEINAAISKAKGEGGGQSAVNENSNGNALAFIAMRFNRG
jgi:hypothetical protein